MAKGEENAKICWYCQKIAHCYPCKRPQNNCPCFAPMGEVISHKMIAKWLNTSLTKLYDQLREYGAEYIIARCKEHGHNVRYQIIDKYTRFYELNTGAQFALYGTKQKEHENLCLSKPSTTIQPPIEFMMNLKSTSAGKTR